MSRQKRIAKPFFFVLGIVLAIAMMLPYLFLRDELRRFSGLGYLGLFLSCVISNLSVFLPTSSTVYVLLASSVLNPALCVILGSAGAALGELGSYYSGRMFGLSENREKQYAPWKIKIAAYMDRHGFLTVLFFALVPMPVFDVAGVVAGAEKMKLWKYMLAGFIGKALKYSCVLLLVRAGLPYLQNSGNLNLDSLLRFLKLNQ